MTMIDGDLWVAATYDHDLERHREQINAAYNALRPVVATLVEAQTDDGFADRLALASDSIERVVARVTMDDPTLFPVVHDAVLVGIQADWAGTKQFRQVEAQRRNAPRAFTRAQARARAVGSRLRGHPSVPKPRTKRSNSARPRAFGLTWMKS